MRKVCLFCERTSPDDNLLCQEVYCPAETSPYILEAGEQLGDIEIVRPLIVLRSAALYDVRQGQQRALLKVAHPGHDHTERLKREADFLSEKATRQAREPGLPRLLPPYLNTSAPGDSYGRAILQRKLLYYCLFEYVEGVPLRDVMIDRPQLGIFHVGWLVASLAETVAYLQSRGYYHYGLSPETVLVHFNELNVPQTLLWDLGIVTDGKGLPKHWYRSFMHPAYAAPELLEATRPLAHYATDVYGLGLILYELLTGAPAFPYRLRGDAEVRELVLTSGELRTGRGADVREVADLTDQAIQKALGKRQQNARELVNALRVTVGKPPAPKKSWMFTPRTALIAIVVLLAIAFLITLGISFIEMLPKILSR